jgi:hypothetical protein
MAFQQLEDSIRNILKRLGVLENVVTPTPAPATTSVAGVVELATSAEVIAGASSVLAVTPAAYAAAISAMLTARGVPYRFAAGINSVNSVSAGNSNNVYWNNEQAITLPAGRFSVTPVIQVSVVDTGTGSVMGAATVESASSSAFTVRLTRLGATPRTEYRVHWTATQMTSISAGG